jgi:lysophospholipase L1-like esterase
MVGTNDLAYGKTKEYVVQNYRKILERIKKDTPSTRVFVQSVLPVDETKHAERPNAAINYINTQLKKMSASFGYTYLDVASIFEKGGQLNLAYSIDGLHVNGAGYEIWKKYIRSYVEE